MLETSSRDPSKRVCNRAMAKCSKIWNASSSLTPISDQIESLCAGKKLLKPTEVKWNSLYACVKRITEIKDKLNELCSIVGIDQFQEVELEFLDGYVLAVRSVTAALDKLQSEND